MYLAFQIFWLEGSKKLGLQAIGDETGQIILEKSAKFATTFQVSVAQFNFDTQKFYYGATSDLLISDCGQLKKLELRSDGFYRSSTASTGNFLRITWNSLNLKWNSPISLKKSCCSLTFSGLAFQLCEDNKTIVQRIEANSTKSITNSGTTQLQILRPRGKVLFCPAFQPTSPGMIVSPMLCLANSPANICGTEVCPVNSRLQNNVCKNEAHSSSNLFEFNIQFLGEGSSVWQTSWENPINSKLQLEFVPALAVGVRTPCVLPIRTFVIRLPGNSKVMEVGRKYPVEIQFGGGFRYLQNPNIVEANHCFTSDEAGPLSLPLNPSNKNPQIKCLKPPKVGKPGPNYDIQYELTTKLSDNIVRFVPTVTGDVNQFVFPANSFENLCFPSRTCCSQLSLFVGYTAAPRKAVVSSNTVGSSSGVTDLIFSSTPFLANAVPKKSGTTAVPKDEQLTALQVPLLNTQPPRGTTTTTNNTTQTHRRIPPLTWVLIILFIILVIMTIGFLAIRGYDSMTSPPPEEIEPLTFGVPTDPVYPTSVYEY